MSSKSNSSRGNDIQSQAAESSQVVQKALSDDTSLKYPRRGLSVNENQVTTAEAPDVVRLVNVAVSASLLFNNGRSIDVNFHAGSCENRKMPSDVQEIIDEAFARVRTVLDSKANL